MLIQGERVNSLNIEQLIENIFGDSEHEKRKQSIANAVLGVISSASLIVHRVGLALATAKYYWGSKKNSCSNGLDRF